LWTEFASKYYGIFKVAAINCAAESEICDDEFQVYEFPKVLAYPANIR
jgi:DnaJ family protein C protein 16